MSKEQLWSDKKIKDLTVLAANTVDPQARWLHEQIAKDMRNDYERALAFRNEDIGRLQGELKQAMARIALLEAPAKYSGPVTDKFDPGLLMVHLNHPCYELDSFYAGSQADADAVRGQGYVSLAELRKIQPAP